MNSIKTRGYRIKREIRPNSSGFTLMELVIAICIVGILASIAVPSYTSYIRRAKTTEATSNLLQMAALQEQFYRDFRVYALSYGAGAPPTVTNDVTNIDGIIPWGSVVTSTASSTPSDNFDYKIETDTTGATKGQAFVIHAYGKASENMSSYIYAINRNNVKCKCEDGGVLNLKSSDTACPNRTDITVW